MSRRKTIALINLMPEDLHSKRVMDGVFGQCDKYGYNVALFSSMTPLNFFYQDYADGEKHIYDLPNFSAFDGIILDTLTLTFDNDHSLTERIMDQINRGSHGPVVSLGMPIEGCKTIVGTNDAQLREMCRHTVEVHGKKDILLLTGPKDNSEAESRLAIFKDELDRLGIEVDDDHVVYGNFWYSCGERLAEEILSGARPMPEAVIAASDHMALGLMEMLTASGVRIPKDLMLVGFEATQEAMLSDVSLSSYESNYSKTAADAVDYIRSVIEPEAPILPRELDLKKMFHPGMSCGCQPDLTLSAAAFKDALYFTHRNYTSDVMNNNVDIGLLMENYVSEMLTGSDTPQKCIENIYLNTYLLLPYMNFSICLREDWLSAEKEEFVGYPEQMKIALTATTTNGPDYFSEEDSVTFDTKLMIPAMQEYTEKPCVFYFSAVHFGGMMLGYSVMQRELSDRHKLNLVFRNWLRLVNNSLEMVRSKNRYVMLSIRDNMTGLYNRRGMNEMFEELSAKSQPTDRLFACVIDMDGLKLINDNHGHSEGDFGIITVSRAVKRICRCNELSIRAGGDEFFILGLGEYLPEECDKRREEFLSAMEELSAESGKPYQICASIGCALGEEGSRDPEELLSAADRDMYRFKTMRKKHRE